MALSGKSTVLDRQWQKPVILDLFCGAGGAAMGYFLAGFAVVGVDLRPQPNYPFEFHRVDAFDALRAMTGHGPLRDEEWCRRDRFDAVHASPPCQGYSDLRSLSGHVADADIDTLRAALVDRGLTYVIENVEGAPLRDPVVLCGTMFSDLRVVRHRLFECSWPLRQPPHPDGRHPRVYSRDARRDQDGLDQDQDFVQVTGGGNASAKNKLAAMGVDWMTGEEVNQAIPPAYTEYVGLQLRSHLRTVRA